MLKIGTHDSATGEKPTWWSWITIPLARTQSKTIKEQYEAGCRLFDIRIRKSQGTWKCAHGLFITKRTAWSIFAEINSFEEPCNVSITYEGKGDEEFLDFVHRVKTSFTNIKWGGVAVKYGVECKGVEVKYNYLEGSDKDYEGGVQGFLPLDGRTWHTYLPIPWLWDRLYKRPHVFNEKTFTYVDFL